PRFLWEGRSLPLNANPGGPVRAEAECGLVPGATLLLYTDGLVERRDRSLDEGMQALIDAMADLRDLEPAALTEALTDGLGRRGPGGCARVCSSPTTRGRPTARRAARCSRSSTVTSTSCSRAPWRRRSCTCRARPPTPPSWARCCGARCAPRSGCRSAWGSR